MNTTTGVSIIPDKMVSDEQWDELFPDEITKSMTLNKPMVSEEVKPIKIKTERFSSDPKPFPIWFSHNGKIVITYDMVIEFLKRKGFGVLDKSQMIQIENNLIVSSDKDDVTAFIYDHFMGFDESDFSDLSKLGVVKSEKEILDDDGNVTDLKIIYFTKSEVESAIIRFGGFSKEKRYYINKYRSDKKIFKKELKKKVPNLYEIPIFSDNENEVFTFFDNGVVKTDKTGSKLVGYDVLDDGYIWDSRILTNIDGVNIDTKRKGIFEDFVEKSMMDKIDGKWVINEKEYESLRTIIGYLISNYTNDGLTPCPIFVDRESDGFSAEGGNGKSLVMRSIREWKKDYCIGGRGIDPMSSRFLFSGVQLDTGFVWIDDAEKDFDFQRLYCFTTGDMEIERKGKDRINIPMDTKPKMGITTNYILPDTDGSTQRRQYIVEFGSYWHDKKEQNIQPSDIYKRKFFGHSFTDEDWMDFYNFGFRCIQEFLQKGVVQSDHQSYKEKQLISQIEGAGNNEGVCEWIQRYITDNESQLKSNDGILYEEIFSDFQNEFEFDILENWSSTRFKKSIFDICQEMGWEYNPHKSHRGKNLSDRKFLTGSKHNQKETIRIVK